MTKILEVKTKAELDAALAKAQTKRVAVDFVQDGCGACDDAKPATESFASCAQDLTVLRVNLSKADDALVDPFSSKVDGTPTTLLGTAEAFKDGKVDQLKEIDPTDPAVRRQFKCAVPAKKGTP